MSREERPMRPLVDGGDGSAEHGNFALLLKSVRDDELPPGFEERVWRKMQDNRRGTANLQWWRLRSHWAVPATLAAAVVTLLVLRGLSPNDENRLLTMVLVAGDVELQQAGVAPSRPSAGDSVPSGARVTTGTRSRAFVRGAQFGALFTEQVSALLQTGDTPSIDLAQGYVAVAVKTRKGKAPFVVRAQGYEVRVTGTVFSVSANQGGVVDVAVTEGTVEVAGHGQESSVTAGECWSNSGTAPRPCAPDPEHATARALAAVVGTEARLRVDGPGAEDVRVGTIALGKRPIDWLAPADTQLLVGARERETVTTTVSLSPGIDQQYVFECSGARRADEPRASPRVERAAAASTEDDADRGDPGRAGSHGATAGTNVRTERSPARIKAPSPTDRSVGSTSSPSEVRGAEPHCGRASDNSAPLQTAAEAPPAAVDAPAALDPGTEYATAKQLERSGKYEEAVGTLVDVASGSGPFAELATYEVGWIRLKYLGDPVGAASDCEAYRRRYPDGRLSQEVGLNLVQALIDSHRPEAALGEAAAFLKNHPTSERAREVALLRSNLLCEQRRFEAARQAYRALVTGQDRFAEEALWNSAVCMVKANRVADAREDVSKYRSRFPGGMHRADPDPVPSGDESFER